MAQTIILPESWNGWTITELTGTGSYGSVYKARFLSDDADTPEQVSAIKIIEVPSDEDPLYSDTLIDSLLQEIRTMESLKDNPNAVSLQDHYVRRGGTGRTIFIRMEYLTPFTEYKVSKEIGESDVIRLGLDMCNVLEECAGKGILHRDIKPENIMVDENGRFKLGDFGIAKKMETAYGEMSVKGTFTYMAPEVYHGEPYDIRSDQYSLGIVLYRLMNNNRDPFIDPNAPMASFNDREEALKKRMTGEVLPNPAKAGASLGYVIRKACSYRPENRFESISEMKKALLKCSRGEDFNISNLSEVSEAERLEILRNNSRNRRIIIITLLAACLAVGFGYFVHTQIVRSDEEILFNASRTTEEHIRETGIRKDNAFRETDIQSAEAYADELNSSADNSEIGKMLGQDASDAMTSDDTDLSGYEKCIPSLVFADENNALGIGAYYRIVTDNVTNTEEVLSFCKYFYYIKEGGSWKQAPEIMAPEDIKKSAYNSYLPEGFIKAYNEDRNWCVYPESLWLGKSAVYDTAIKMEIGAAWQNEDGSVDVYVLLRNGTDRLGAEYNYWLMLKTDQDEEVVNCWGVFDADQVTAEAGSVKGYIVRLDAEEVLTGSGRWPDAGLYGFISGNNSNYK